MSSQDPVFSQYYSTPLELNPALAGRTDRGALSMIYRNQWPSIQQAYVTYGVSYDQQFPVINSGLGFSILADNAGDGLYKTINVNAAYSYLAQLKNDIGLRIGLSAGAIQARVDWPNIVFPDQVNPEFGVVSPGGLPLPTEESIPQENSITSLDFSVGALLYNTNFYVGAALEHLNSPNLSFFNSPTADGSLEMRVSLHAGAEFDVFGSFGLHDFVFWSPSVQYTKQSSISQLNLGSFVRYSSISVGAWYRQANTIPDAIILALGLHQDDFRLTYSYDITISALQNSGGAHEISFLYYFDKDVSQLNDCFNMFR